jgi:hypothetical protein
MTEPSAFRAGLVAFRWVGISGIAGSGIQALQPTLVGNDCKAREAAGGIERFRGIMYPY